MLSFSMLDIAAAVDDKKTGFKVRVIPVDNSTKGMMDHLKVSADVSIIIKAEPNSDITIKNVYDQLKLKQWK